MRDFLIKFFAVCGVLTMFGLLQACFSDSNADGGSSGMSKAEVEALLAPLEQRIAALEAAAGPYNRLYVADSGGIAGLAKTASGATTLAALGDPLDCKEDDANLQFCRVVTPTGYLVGVPINQSPTSPVGMGYVYYEQVGCTGTPYFIYYGSAYKQGFVTRDRENVYYRPHGSEHVNVTVLSYSGQRTPCVDMPAAQDINAWPLLENDPEVTGIESSYSGEVTFLR